MENIEQEKRLYNTYGCTPCFVLINRIGGDQKTVVINAKPINKKKTINKEKVYKYSEKIGKNY